MTRFELPAHRKVKHLTLHRQERKISIKEYQTLSASERLEMVRQAQGKEKYDLILNAPDAEQLVPQLHPQEIYLTVHEIGPEYAVELLMLTTTRQLTTLLDLDCWEEDSLSEKSVLAWLQLLLESGEENVCRTVREIEPELLTMFLKKLIRVTRGPEAYDDDDAENANRLEGLYDIEYRNEDSQIVVQALLAILLRYDQESYLLLMEMVRNELDSSLEEEVYQDRNCRLLDLGFSTPAEARSLYTYVDPDTFKPTSGKHFDLEAEGMQHPAALLSRAQPTDLMADILANGLDIDQATELCLLANRKMSADRTNLSDSKEVAQSLKHLYHTLNLALELLSEREGLDARKLFQDYYLLQLFQIGHSLTERLKRAAEEILQSPIAPFLDGPYRRFAEALTASPPKLFNGIRMAITQDEKEFQNRADLKQAEDYLQQLSIQQELFCGVLPFPLPEEDTIDLKGCQPEQISDLTLSDLFLTALANRLLGNDFNPEPIAAEELPTLHAMLCDNKKLSSKVREETSAYMDSILRGAGQFAEFCMEIWQEEFCVLEVTEIDPRYVSGLIVRC